VELSKRGDEEELMEVMDVDLSDIWASLSFQPPPHPPIVVQDNDQEKEKGDDQTLDIIEEDGFSDTKEKEIENEKKEEEGGGLISIEKEEEKQLDFNDEKSGMNPLFPSPIVIQSDLSHEEVLSTISTQTTPRLSISMITNKNNLPTFSPTSPSSPSISDGLTTSSSDDPSYSPQQKVFFEQPTVVGEQSKNNGFSEKTLPQKHTKKYSKKIVKKGSNSKSLSKKLKKKRNSSSSPLSSGGDNSPTHHQSKINKDSSSFSSSSKYFSFTSHCLLVFSILLFVCSLLMNVWSFQQYYRYNQLQFSSRLLLNQSDEGMVSQMANESIMDGGYLASWLYLFTHFHSSFFISCDSNQSTSISSSNSLSFHIYTTDPTPSPILIQIEGFLSFFL